MNEHQQLTRYIKHLADSANFEGVTLIQHLKGLIGHLFKMPNISYACPLMKIAIFRLINSKKAKLITTTSTRIKPSGCAEVINILDFAVDNFYSVGIWV